MLTWTFSSSAKPRPCECRCWTNRAMSTSLQTSRTSSSTPSLLTLILLPSYGDHRMVGHQPAAYIRQNRTSEASMTRALVFLAATLVAASLGGVAQESSTASKQGSSPTLQSSTDNRVPSEATSDTRTAAAN